MRRPWLAAGLLCLVAWPGPAQPVANEAAASPPDGTAALRALGADEACDGPSSPSCGLELLQLRGRAVRARGGTAAAEAASGGGQAGAVLERSSAVMGFASRADFEAYEAAVDEVIEEAFKNVTGLGQYLESDVKEDQTWRVCTAVNWTAEAAQERRAHYGKRPARPSAEINAMFIELNIDKACHTENGNARDNDTCKAIYAGIEVMDMLADKYPEGPKFVNYLLVAWGSQPSWERGAVSNIDYTAIPPRATVVNPNGANLYGLCDIIRTVLTESPNQMLTGTCGYIASLAAVSRVAPAKAIKMGVRLMWTGRVRPLVEPPCEYIFEQQPGLVPWQDNSGDWHPREAAGTMAVELPVSCSGTATDCATMSGQPLQNVGLAFMWSQSLVASFFREASHGCPAQGPAGLNFPGQSQAAAEVIASVQGSSLGSQLWACEMVLDPVGKSCTFVVNLDTCGDVGDGDCKLLKAYQFDELQFDELYDAIDEGLTANKSLRAAVQPVVAKYKRAEEYVDFLEKIAKNMAGVFDMSLLQSLIYFIQYDSTFRPQGTEEMLRLACEAPIAMLAVDSSPLLGIPGAREDPGNPRPNEVFARSDFTSKGRCDHSVYLEKCDPVRNVYTLWTWGKRVYVKKELILGKPLIPEDLPPGLTRSNTTYNTGILCFVVLAEGVTYAHVH